MMKSRELSEPGSCLSKARDTEIVFVLLARDAAAPVAIRAWVDERIRLGKNAGSDPQVLEALECARAMERQRGVPTPDVSTPSPAEQPREGLEEKS